MSEGRRGGCVVCHEPRRHAHVQQGKEREVAVVVVHRAFLQLLVHAGG